MGWGTDFSVNVFLNKLIVENKYQAEDMIAELDEYIEDYKRKLAMYAASNPNDLVRDTEWKDQPVDWLNMQINEIWESLLDDYHRKIYLKLYIEHLEQEEWRKENLNIEEVTKDVKPTDLNVDND
jgi:hypothetical protein